MKMCKRAYCLTNSTGDSPKTLTIGNSEQKMVRKAHSTHETQNAIGTMIIYSGVVSGVLPSLTSGGGSGDGDGGGSLISWPLQ